MMPRACFATESPTESAYVAKAARKGAMTLVYRVRRVEAGEAMRGTAAGGKEVQDREDEDR